MSPGVPQLLSSSNSLVKHAPCGIMPGLKLPSARSHGPIRLRAAEKQQQACGLRSIWPGRQGFTEMLIGPELPDHARPLQLDTGLGMWQGSLRDTSTCFQMCLQHNMKVSNLQALGRLLKVRMQLLLAILLHWMTLLCIVSG